MHEELSQVVSGQKRVLVIYHKGCRDGFTAAWVARKYFKEKGVEPTFHPAQYGDAPPDVAGADVYILDFSYPRGVLEKMNAEAASLVVLDHHKTAEEDLRGLDFAIFDMNRSGAGLAWDTLFPGQPRPWIVSYVEDRDIWRFDLPQSKEVNTVIGTTPMWPDRWDKLAARDVGDVAKEGLAMVLHEFALRDRIIKNAKTVKLGFSRAAVVNTPILISEVGDTLASSHNFVVCWYEQTDGGRIFSLRSRKQGGADVSKLAKMFGGGGHASSAGFRLQALHPYYDHPRDLATEMLRVLEGADNG